MALDPHGVAVPFPLQNGGFFYITEFVSTAEEAYLLHKIDTAPARRWKQLAHRRLQMWGGELTERTGTLIAEPLPPWLTDYPALVPRLAALDIFEASRFRAPNHCLINEYLAGQGILPHTDGPAYVPAVATVSLGDETMMDIYGPAGDGADASQPLFSLALAPRSLVVTRGDAYTQLRHGIAERTHDTPDHYRRAVNCTDVPAAPHARTRRVSLTFRAVDKVHRGLRLPGAK